MNPLLAFLKFGSLAQHVAELRQRARVDLRNIHVRSVTPALQLSGAEAEIMDESENVLHNDGRVDGYYLTQIVRNRAGEYFLLKTTDKAPFVKHLPHARAKAVLKDKYLAQDHVPRSHA